MVSGTRKCTLNSSQEKMNKTSLYQSKNNIQETGHKSVTSQLAEERLTIKSQRHRKYSYSDNDSSINPDLAPLADSCIICVGSTGAGKSSTVSKYTGVVTRSGSGTERVTKHCHLIRHQGIYF